MTTPRRIAAVARHEGLPARPSMVAVCLVRRAESGLSPITLGLALAAIAWVRRQGRRRIIH